MSQTPARELLLGTSAEALVLPSGNSNMQIRIWRNSPMRQNTAAFSAIWCNPQAMPVTLEAPRKPNGNLSEEHIDFELMAVGSRRNSLHGKKLRMRAYQFLRKSKKHGLTKL